MTTGSPSPAVKGARTPRGAWQGFNRADVIAGITVAAVTVPSALSYAVIIGVDPIIGLYTVPIALVAYALVGSSRLLVVGPDAALSVLAASTIARATTDQADRVSALIVLTMMVGGLFLLARALRMGWLADLVPDPVMNGFVQGLAFITIVGQIPTLLGYKASGAHFWAQTWNTITGLSQIQPTTAALGVGSLVALFVLPRLSRRLPWPLLVLAGSMVAVAALGLGNNPVPVVAEPTGGFITLHLPTGLTASQWGAMFPGAVAIVVVGFTESMAAAKSSANATGERLRPNDELAGLGLSNIGSGLCGGYVVTGALSKTSVAVASGGRTQLTNVVAAIGALIALLALRPIFTDIASTVLAALIIYAMAMTVRRRYFTDLSKISRLELVVSALTFLGVLSFGVLPGVVVGVALSMVILINLLGRPYGTRLGRSEAGQWFEYADYPDDERPDDALPPSLWIYQQESPVVFLNARRTTDVLRDQAAACPDRSVMVLTAQSVTSLDSTGIDAIVTLSQELAQRNIEVWFVRPNRHLDGGIIDRSDQIQDRIHLRGFDTLEEAVAAFEARSAAGEGSDARSEGHQPG